MRRFNVKVDGSLFLFGAFLLLILPLDWILAMLVAALIHELGHAVMVKLCGLAVRSVRLTPGGVRMYIPGTTPKRELLCALGGPLFGLGMILLYPFFPKIAFCAWIHTAFNLIPLHQSDGARILRCLLTVILREKNSHCIYHIVRVTSTVCMLILFLFLLLHPALLPIAAVGFLRKRWGRGRLDKLSNRATLVLSEIRRR